MLSIDKFWSEYKDFSNKTGVFSKAGRWATADAIAGSGPVAGMRNTLWILRLYWDLLRVE